MSDDVNMVECPAEGCSYDGLPTSVKAHYSGKQDSDHSGGYRKAESLLEGSDSPETTTETETDSTDGGETETEPNSPTFPEADDNSSEPTETETAGRETCPKCGGETDTVAPGTLAQTEEHGRVRTESGDRYCAACDVLIAVDGEVIR